MSYKSPWHLKFLMFAGVPAVVLAALAALAMASPSTLRPAWAPRATAGPEAAPTPEDAPAPQAAPTPEAAPRPPTPAAAPAPPRPPEPPGEDEDGGDEVIRERAWLGITLSEIDEKGARVDSVQEDSPADQAGLRRGDVILEIEGRKVASSRDVVRAVRGSSPGDRIRIRVERDGEERTLTATLDGRRERRRHEFHFRTPDGEDIQEHFLFGESRTFLGVEILPMSEDLRAAMKAPRDRGLLINRVMEDSPAQAAGLRAGDIIIDVDGEEISQVGDIRRALQDRDEGDEVAVRVVRDGSERTLDVQVAERPGPRPRRQRGLLDAPRFRQKLVWDLPDDESEALRRSVREALEASHEAIREVEEQMRGQEEQLLQQSELIQEQVGEQIQKQLREQMKQLEETLRLAPEVVVKKKVVYDI